MQLVFVSPSSYLLDLGRVVALATTRGIRDAKGGGRRRWEGQGTGAGRPEIHKLADRQDLSKSDPAPSGGLSPRRSGGSPRFQEALGVRGAARAGGAGDRRSRRPGRDAAGDPARGERPPVRSPCGWWLLIVWSLPLASGELCAPLAHGRLRCLQVSVFANRSWARTDGLARLGELQTYSWSNGSDAIRFLRPWARGGFSEPQWERLRQILRVYRRSFTRDVREFVKMLRLDYPFEIQLSAGCELCPGNTSESFLRAAFQGKEIMSFQGTHWVPAPDAPSWAGRATKELNQDQGTRKTLQWFLNDTCPQFVRGLLEAGKSELEKQGKAFLQKPTRMDRVMSSISSGGNVGCRVPALTPPTSLSDTVKPESWLSTGPRPGPGRLLLVCHVSGFHPKPVWVMWMRGEQEQQGTQRGDVLPHADGTWYLRATLDVVAREAAGLSCRVRHSSLGNQDIVLHWGGSHSSTWLILVAILGSLLMSGCVGCLVLWCRKRCPLSSYQGML